MIEYKDASAEVRHALNIATELTVTYPANHPDASLANKTRVFPAIELCNLPGAPLS